MKTRQRPSASDSFHCTWRAWQVVAATGQTAMHWGTGMPVVRKSSAELLCRSPSIADGHTHRSDFTGLLGAALRQHARHAVRFGQVCVSIRTRFSTSGTGVVSIKLAVAAPSCYARPECSLLSYALSLELLAACMSMRDHRCAPNLTRLGDSDWSKGSSMLSGFCQSSQPN